VLDGAAPPETAREVTPARSGADVVDLGPTVSATRVVLDRDLGPLDRLSADDKRRLLVRVLCGLVAYDEEPAEPSSPRMAG
jgi:hypothetical protein